MKTKISSEFIFTKEVLPKMVVKLTLYINYKNKSYDFMQDCEEGIFPRNNNKNIAINRAYLELGLEILEFVKEELNLEN